MKGPSLTNVKEERMQRRGHLAPRVSLDHERTKFYQCKGGKDDKGEATWPQGLVWTMKGPSFTNVKEERMTKERPPGPEGFHRPPPPPSPVISKDPFHGI